MLSETRISNFGEITRKYERENEIKIPKKSQDHNSFPFVLSQKSVLFPSFHDRKGSLCTSPILISIESLGQGQITDAWSLASDL